MKLQESHCDPLLRSRQLLSSLSDSIPAVRFLAGRWSAVSAALRRLSVAVDDLSAASSAVSHPLAADLLVSLPETLTLTLALCNLCSSAAGPPAGRLRTLSDLAAAAAALENLAADADLLLRSGALETLTLAPASSLAIRLQIGPPAARAAAIDALLAGGDEVLLAAGEDLIPAVVRLLDSPCRETRSKAATAIARISAIEGFQSALSAEGPVLLSLLSRLLDSAAVESVCVALQALTLTRDGAMTLGSLGCVGKLVGICQAGTPASRSVAVGILKNLAGAPELRGSFLEDDAVSVLIKVLASGTALSRENSVACLRNLTGDGGIDLDLILKQSIVKEGGLDWLKSYWVGGEDRNLEPAIGLLRNLASCKDIVEMIVSSGFLPLVILALENSGSSVRAEAAKLISELVSVRKAKEEIGDGQCVPRLVVMLEAKKVEEKDAAIMALASLMSFPGNQSKFKSEEKGIENVVQLLDPLVWGVDMKYPLLVLESVSKSRSCREKMVAAMARGYLQRLVDLEVEGAKRLLESLGKGKGFWDPW